MGAGTPSPLATPLIVIQGILLDEASGIRKKVEPMIVAKEIEKPAIRTTWNKEVSRTACTKWLKADTHICLPVKRLGKIQKSVTSLFYGATNCA